MNVIAPIISIGRFSCGKISGPGLETPSPRSSAATGLQVVIMYLRSGLHVAYEMVTGSASGQDLGRAFVVPKSLLT